MDLEEAKLKAKITPEERAAVERYINFYHASINAIIGFDVEQYIESSKRWVLPGINSDKTKEEVGEEVLQSIEDAAKVFSVMVKTMYNTPAPYKLMRGTSDDEAKKLREGYEYDRIISTSTSETTAKSFGRYGNAAFLRIIPGNDIPFLNVEDFVGKENLDRDESEYILAPFSRIKSAKFRSDYNGFKYYDVEIEKPELRSFGEGEKENLESEIKEKFADIVQKGKLIKELKERHEWNYDRLHRTNNSEDKKYIWEDNERILEEIRQLSPEVEAFEAIMKKYVQGIFVERQKEFEIAYEINRKEEIRIIQEQEKLRQQESIKEKQKSFGEVKTKFHGIMDKAPNILTEQYHALKDEEMKYYNMAKILRNSI